MKTMIWIALAVLLCLQDLYAQSDRQNLEKYWYMKKRLTERFLRVGDKPGYNIPSGRLVFAPSAYWDNLAPVQSRIEWGDGTIHLGWYIGVLATELELLQRHNLPTDKTAEELFYALETIDRLDRVAEKVWSYYDENDVPICESLFGCGGIHVDHTIPDSKDFVAANLTPVPYDESSDTWDPANVSSELNGFTIRDDIPATILEDFDFPYTSMSSSMARPDSADWTQPPFVYTYNNYLSNSPPANEMSQDQVFNMLLGLVLSKEYCSDVTFSGQNLGSKASVIASRLLDYYNGLWIIKNPVRDKDVLIGGNSAAYIVSLNKLKNYFDTGNKNNIYGQGVWPPGDNEVNRVLYAIIIAISNSAAPSSLKSFTDGSVGWEFYSLLNNTLYNHSNNYYPPESIKTDLNSCPCRGPYQENIQWTADESYKINGSWVKIYPDGVPTKWNTGNCFKDVESDLPSNNPLHVTPDGVFWTWYSYQYNGLDYMLLYNLYRMNYDDQDVFPYTDMRDAYVTGILPEGSEGTVNNFRTYNSFESLAADVKLTAPVDNIPAGALMYAKSIKFIPGFHVKAGARLVAQIHTDDIYECWSGTYRIVPVGSDVPLARPEIIIRNELENDELSKQQGDLRESDNRILVFPNPAANDVWVSGVDCIEQISITTSTGVTIRKTRQKTNKIDLNGISDGTYFLKITDCESKKYYVKLVVSH